MSKTTGRYRRWCFTWNNYTDDQVENLSTIDKDRCDYIIFGREEAPETGTPHLQGYIEFAKAMTMGQCKTALDPINKGKSTVNVRQALGTHDENTKYCSKADANAVEVIHTVKKAGKSEDPSVWQSILALINTGADYNQVLQAFPASAMKFSSGIKTAIASVSSTTMTKQLLDRYDDMPLRPWQSALVKEVSFPPDDRKVIWYVDLEGNAGKTIISKYLLATRKGAYFTNGRSTDIACAYNGEPIVVFDFARTTEERINYQAIESIKNGIMFSPKYESRTKVFNSPWVIVMANFPPNIDSLSKDRWDIRWLEPTIYDETPGRRHLVVDGQSTSPYTPFIMDNIKQNDDDIVDISGIMTHKIYDPMVSTTTKKTEGIACKYGVYKDTPIDITPLSVEISTCKHGTYGTDPKPFDVLRVRDSKIISSW